MILNEFGKIASNCWQDLPDHFSNTSLDEFTIMPNHIHGIIILEERRDTACRVSTNKFGKPIKSSLGTIIRSFKSAVTKSINQTAGTREKSIWQPNYYDHIIRNATDLHRIKKYINLNPLKWELDELYTL